MNPSIDHVRRREHRTSNIEHQQIKKLGDDRGSGSRQLCLYNPENPEDHRFEAWRLVHGGSVPPKALEARSATRRTRDATGRTRDAHAAESVVAPQPGFSLAHFR